jgi:hypothetical protein
VFSRRDNVELPYIAGCFHTLTSAADCDDMFNLLAFNGDFFQAILRVHRVLSYLCLSFFFSFVFAYMRRPFTRLRTAAFPFQMDRRTFYKFPIRCLPAPSRRLIEVCRLPVSSARTSRKQKTVSLMARLP